MSLFDRLGARALGSAKGLEPIIDPSPPWSSASAEASFGFDEVTIEEPARSSTPGPSSRPAASHRALPIPASSTPASTRPPVVEARIEGPQQTKTPEVPAPRVAPPRPAPPVVRSEPEARILPGTTVVEHHIERTREILREVPIPASTRPATPSPEPTAPLLRTPVRAQLSSHGGAHHPRRPALVRPAAAAPLRPASPPTREAPAPERGQAPRTRPIPRPEPPVDQRLSGLEPPPAPVVQVSIGRVIVRAEEPRASTPPPRPSASSARPGMSLATYLAERDRSER